MATNNFEGEIKKVFENNWSNGNVLSKEQLKTLKEYVDYYSNKKSSKGGIIKSSSVWNALHTLRMLGVYVKKPFEEVTKEDLLNFFTKHLKGKSVATTSNWKVIIRSFYKWKYGMKKKHEFPEIVDDERLEPVRAPPRKVSGGDLFTKDEVLKMIKACYNPMDKAIISIWFEMGLRAKEYVSANVDSVEMVSGGAKFFIEESKTETGFVPLLMSAPYLEEWLRVHPYKNDPKAPLFVAMKRRKKGERYKRLLPNGINEKLKRISQRAGIKKRIFTHLGRNISITNMDGILSVEDNARLHGITPATIFNIYTRRTRKEASKKYIEAFGKDKTPEELVKDKKEKEKLLPKVCENCGTSNPFDRNFCKQCLRPIDIKTFLKLDERRKNEEKVLDTAMNKGLALNKETIKEVVKELILSGDLKV